MEEQERDVIIDLEVEREGDRNVGGDSEDAGRGGVQGAEAGRGRGASRMPGLGRCSLEELEREIERRRMEERDG